MTKPKQVTKGGRKYTRMDKIDLDEISAVDFPAQTPAKATIIKRATTADETESQVQDIQKRVQLTMPVDGHSHMVVTSTAYGELDAGDTSWENGHTHPWVKGQSGIISIGASDNHIHTMDALATSVAKSEDTDKPEDGNTADPLTKADDSASTQPAEGLGDQAMTKKTDKAADAKAPTKDEFDALAKRAERAETVSELSDSQRAVYSKMDKSEQDEFLALDTDARTAVVTKSADADPVVYKTSAGVELRKSAGELLISMAKSNDDMAKQLSASEDLRKSADLEKRAGEQLGHLTGEKETHIALLKAVDTIDEATRPAVLELLKSQDLGIKAAYEKRGVSGAPTEGGSPADKLDTLAKARSSKEGISFTKAYSDVIQSDEGKALYAEHLNG